MKYLRISVKLLKSFLVVLECSSLLSLVDGLERSLNILPEFDHCKILFSFVSVVLKESEFLPLSDTMTKFVFNKDDDEHFESNLKHF